MPRALEDMRVIDCGVMQLGPTAATLLRDLGADVCTHGTTICICISRNPRLVRSPSATATTTEKR